MILSSCFDLFILFVNQMIQSYLKEAEKFAEQIVIMASDGTILAQTKQMDFNEDELGKISILITQPEKKIGTTIEFRNEEYLVINHSMKHLIAVRSFNGIVARKIRNGYIVTYFSESHEAGECYKAISGLADGIDSQDILPK